MKFVKSNRTFVEVRDKIGTDPTDFSTYFGGALNILGCMYLAPFKVKWDCRNSRYYLHSSKFRKIMCGILHLSGVILVAAAILGQCFFTVLSRQSDELVNIIIAAEFLWHTVFELMLIKVLWMDQHLIESFLNTPSYSRSRVSIYKVLTVAGITLFLALFDMYFSNDYSNQMFFPTDKQNCYYPLAALSDMLDASMQSSNSGYNIILTIFSTVLKITISIMFGLGSLFIYFDDGICFVLSFNMWQIGKNFEIKLDENLSFKEGLQIYTEHRNAINAANKVSSTLFLLQLITSLVYYSQAPIIYHTESVYWHEKIIMVGYLIHTATLWGLVGECHAVTRRTIKKWVSKKQELADESTSIHEQFQLTAISHNLDSDPIALSCSFFAVTYRFEASMLSLLLSYTVIMFQMGNKATHTPDERITS